MCTVSIFPTDKNNFVLTSNRDEAPNRIPLHPDVYNINNTQMLFPKDKTAGGSWIGASDKKRVLCVLNGGFARHKREASYRLSRGVVMRDLLSCNDINNAITDYDLLGVEPFTLVIADWNISLRFFELVWDGEKKHFKELPLEPKMWSSSTLYTEEMKRERQQWFDNYKDHNELNTVSILNFHKTTEVENTEYGIVMDRLFVKTTSITQVSKDDECLKMHFNNLIDSTESEYDFKIS